VTAFWCEQAHLAGGVASSVRLTTVGGRIETVMADAPPERGDERLPGLTLPGLANAHSHAFHRALRGRTHGGGGTFWTWRREMYAVTARLDPDRYLALARAVYGEMALAGYTVVGEFHYVHHDLGGRPYAEPNAMGVALVEAARDAGIRLTLLDTVYLAGGLEPSGYASPDETQTRFSDGSVDGWLDRVRGVEDTDLARLGLAAHSVRAVPRQQLAEVAVGRDALARDRRRPVPVHAHVSEQPAENSAVRAFHGTTPVGLLAEAGLLGPELTAVHATHLTDEDVALLGGTAGGACFCPTTERDLADGIGPARALHDAGAVLSLGSDQHAVIDPFEEVRGLEMHERLATNERGRFAPSELVGAATVSGYRSLGWPDGGALRTGGLADFTTVRLDSVRTVGSEPDQVVLAATSADVTHTVVGGEVVVRDGRHTRLGDVARALDRALAPLREA
jgi:formiminoglutamate deiminase